MAAPISVPVRTKKAYRLTNKFLFSYVSLYIGKKIFGNRFYERRIDAVHTKNAKRLKEAILELQGLFTKAGQLISTLSHILPDQYMLTLESLQDDAPSSPFTESKQLIEKELGGPLQIFFREFDERPIASASIGQVFKATLITGEKVAVKVQHPQIEELAKADLAIIEKLIKRVSYFIKIQGMEHVYEQVKSMIEDELNYSKEALSMISIQDNLKETEGIIIPKVYKDFSSQRVLTTEFIVGTKITNINQLDAWGVDRDALAKKLILVYLKMILEDGFYHADPHPGNILVNEKGDLVILDFGATARLSDEMRKEIPILLQAILRKDEPKILISLRKLGFIGSDKESTKVAEKLISALSNFLQNEVKIDSMNFKDIGIDDIKGTSIDNLRKEIGLKELTKTIRIPKEWILLDRTLQLIFGTSATIAPKMNPLDVIRPYMKRLVTSEGGIKKMIIDAVKQQFTALLELPGEVSTFLRKANKGELEVTVNHSNDRTHVLLRQLILTLLLISSVFLYELRDSAFYSLTSIAFAFALISSLWKNRKS